MKQKKKQFFFALCAFIIIAAAAMPNSVIAPLSPRTADALPIFTITASTFKPFGGKIEEKELHFCLRHLDFFPYILVIPFYTIEVYKPTPANMYYLFGISQLYLEYELEETVNSVGNYAFEADKAFREFCDINGQLLPKEGEDGRPYVGVTWKIGTSCKTDTKISECHEQVARRGAKQMAAYQATLAGILAKVGAAQALLEASFKAQGGSSIPGDTAAPSPDYSAFCDSWSPQGQCYPVGTCDPDQSSVNGACATSAGG